MLQESSHSNNNNDNNNNLNAPKSEEKKNEKQREFVVCVCMYVSTVRTYEDTTQRLYCPSLYVRYRQAQRIVTCAVTATVQVTYSYFTNVGQVGHCCFLIC